MANHNRTPEPALRFEKTLVIVGGGAVDPQLLKKLHADGAHVIAADGGADMCAEAGIVPEAILGDIDSLSDPDSWADKTRIFRIAEQQTTDFEKCLYATEAPVTIALGMTGKRFDHTLAALDAIARFAQDKKIVLVGETDLALALAGPFAFSAAVGERISVHPLGRVAFARSAGLRYALDGLVLAPGVRTGTSNEATDGQIVIEPAAGETGVWLLILRRERLEDILSHLAR